MGLKIGGLTDYVKLGGAYETFTNNGEVQVDKGFLEMISKSDDKDCIKSPFSVAEIGVGKEIQRTNLREIDTPYGKAYVSQSGELISTEHDYIDPLRNTGLYQCHLKNKIKKYLEEHGQINPMSKDIVGIVKKNKDNYNPYIMSERPAEYDFRTGRWEYSDTKKRPDIIA